MKNSLFLDDELVKELNRKQTTDEKKMQSYINRKINSINKELMSNLDANLKRERIEAVKTAEMARNYVLM